MRLNLIECQRYWTAHGYESGLATPLTPIRPILRVSWPENISAHRLQTSSSVALSFAFCLCQMRLQ